MITEYTATPFQKILIPITPNCDAQSLLCAACLIASQGRVRLVGLSGIVPGESLSTGAVPSRKVRAILHNLVDGERIQARQRVRVSHDPWDDFLEVLQDENPDLVLLDWQNHFTDLMVTPQEILIRPPSDIALVRGPLAADPGRTLVALRGSPLAEYTLRVALAIARNSSTELTSIHLSPADPNTAQEQAYRGLAKVLDHLPEIQRVEASTDDPLAFILEKAAEFDLLVSGASLHPLPQVSPLGTTAEQLLRHSPNSVIVLKPARSHATSLAYPGASAISVLVDKWFAENTYHSNEFAELDYLIDLKQKQGLAISLALPSLNEEETVGNVIQTIKSHLMDAIPLVDEMILMDSNSTDQTRVIAEDLGVPVYIHQQLLPQYGARNGKGEALWKSLFVTRGDIIIWIDTDIVNIHPRFVYGLLGPLLLRPELQFVKGFYRRPLRVGEKIQAGGGGRVTELTARPLLNLFYPELSGIVQPLSGEYGGRRSALEKLIFYSGYGVETGLLIDLFEKFGLKTLAQVDLQERIHHNQPLESLSKMSFAIIQVVIQKLEKRYGVNILEDVNRSMKLIRYQPGRLFLEVEQIAEELRPPMISLPEYQEQHPA